MSTFVPSLLGGLTPAEFLATRWQNKPLLVRQALPGFRGFLTPADLCRLAEKRDLVSRTVVTTDDHRPTKRFRLHHGPFKKLDAAKQPKNWSLLVQGLAKQSPAIVDGHRTYRLGRPRWTAASR